MQMDKKQVKFHYTLLISKQH